MSTILSQEVPWSLRISNVLLGRRYLKSLLTKEVTGISRYYDKVFQLGQSEMASEDHLSGVPGVQFCSLSATVTKHFQLPADFRDDSKRGFLLLNGNLNHHLDVQRLLLTLGEQMTRSSRIGVILYNPYLSGVYRLLSTMGLRRMPTPTTFFTETQLSHLARLSGFELVRVRRVCFFPWKWLGLGDVLNFLGPVIPGFRRLSFACLAILRPVRPVDAVSGSAKTLSVVIPARNERGNIENALTRFPEELRARSEIIFVEGHSNDGTFEEMQRVQEAYRGRFSIQVLRQTGKGKGDAVTCGFAAAKGDLLTILDADLTMPPEQLPRFVQAYESGMGDFINGNRLLYPYEGGSMRFLNWLGNIFFAKILSLILDVRLGDSLCGTKLFARHDWKRFENWNRDFGKFDPFGDFEMIFPAATLGLGTMDLPIRYFNRTYGQTNIHRFRHGWMLLKMSLTGFVRLRPGRVW